MEVSVEPDLLETQEQRRGKRIQDEIRTDRRLFRKPLLSSFSASVPLCGIQSAYVAHATWPN